MDQHVNRICTLLDLQIDLHGRLLACMEDEKKAAVAGRPDKLTEIVKEKSYLIEHIDQQDRQCRQAVASLAEFLGRPSKDLTLSRLISWLDQSAAARVGKRRARLAGLTRQIVEANQGNRALLTQLLDLTRSSIALLHNLTAQSPVYAKTGRLDDRGTGGRVLSGTI